MTLLSTRGRIVMLIVVAAVPALALTAYSTWDERARAELHDRDDLRRLATLAAQRQEQNHRKRQANADGDCAGPAWRAGRSGALQ